MEESMFKTITVTILCSLFVVTVASAKSTKSRNSESHSSFSSGSSPWDFSAIFGMYPPGIGFGGLVAYKVMDSLLQNTKNSLSAEVGLNYVSYSSTLLGSSYSYSVIEIPIKARWDFTFLDGKLVAGPRLGFNYNTAGTYSVNGITYTGFSSGLAFQIGGFGIYKFSDNFGARVNLDIGSYTTIGLGLTYFM